MHKLEFIIPKKPSKKDPQIGYAYISVLTSEYWKEDEFKKVLKHAVTDWIYNREDGKHAFQKTSNKKMTVSELSICVKRYKSLKVILEEYGIYNLEIDIKIIDNKFDWKMDDLVYNRFAISKLYDKLPRNGK